MPWGIAAAVAAPIVGGAVSSALSPSTSGGGSNLYTPTGLGTADTGWQQLLQSQMGAYSAGNPYGPQYQNFANDAGALYKNLTDQQQQAAAGFNQQAQGAYGAQNYLQGAGQQVFNTAMDPQSALYNRTQQQLTDQVNAGQALRGLGSSAVGGSEYNQAMSNFNIDWQNQQLQRQLQGLQGLGSAYSTAGSYGQLGNQDVNAAMGYNAQVPQTWLTAGQTPYGTANTIQNQQLQQAAGIQSQIIPYLNYGVGAQSPAFTAANQGAGAAGALASQGISGLGSAAQNLFGGGGYGYTGQGSLFGGSAGSSPVTGLSGGTGYGMGTNYGFGFS